MSSTRSKGAALLAPVLLLAAGCASGGRQDGHLLAQPGNTIQLGVPFAKPGAVDGVSFPMLKNASGKPITVTGYHLKNVPAGVKVIGYLVLDVKETAGYRMGVNISPRIPGGTDLTKAADHSGKPIVIPAGQLTDRYIMAKVQITGPVKDMLTGCTIEYTQDGTSYTQTLPCEYMFHPGSDTS